MQKTYSIEDKEHFTKVLTDAQNTIWKVFKQSAVAHKNPSKAFEQIKAKYSDTPAKRFAEKYVDICGDILPTIADPEAYMAEALKATGEMWKKLKTYIEQLYNHDLDDNDNAWNRMINDATKVGYKKWNSNVQEYAKMYSALCVMAIDWEYQRLNKIKDDWEKYI